MLISRVTAVRRLLNSVNTLKNVKNMSSAPYIYRSGALPHSKRTLFLTEAVSGLMWWWVLWHLWHEHEHITGEFPYPEPSKWTDEELGIPSD